MASAPPPAPPPLGPEARARQKREREFRRSRRRARESAGEIKELNITAMMDMMTIILVFLLKSYTSSSLAVNLSDELKLPVSTSQVHAQDNINVTISMREVTVNDRSAVKVENGAIPAGYKEQGRADAFYVGAIYDALKKEVDKQSTSPSTTGASPSPAASTSSPTGASRTGR